MNLLPLILCKTLWCFQSAFFSGLLCFLFYKLPSSFCSSSSSDDDPSFIFLELTLLPKLELDVSSNHSVSFFPHLYRTFVATKLLTYSSRLWYLGCSWMCEDTWLFPFYLQTNAIVIFQRLRHGWWRDGPSPRRTEAKTQLATDFGSWFWLAALCFHLGNVRVSPSLSSSHKNTEQNIVLSSKIYIHIATVSHPRQKSDIPKKTNRKSGNKQDWQENLDSFSSIAQIHSRLR